MYNINLTDNDEMLEVFRLLNIGTDVIKRSNLRSIVENEQNKRRRVQAESAELRNSRLEAQLYRLASLKAKSTTERVLAASDGVLFDVFNQATISPFWLPPAPHNITWEAPWSEFAVADEDRTETKSIQPNFSQKFCNEFSK
jgi:hypothetical protein